ncbi:MAG: magnesium transporter CorA family protein [Chthoniobacterales bacterium]|nr:magnesium transporter CorA family protein [Chthoniobacterales bacterium]
MITFYTAGAPSVALSDNALCSELTRTAGWIDVFEPTREEEEALELALGINVPTRQEMQAIELSSRLYQEDGILFLTATVLTGATTSNPESSAITFILAGEKLVTLRYADPAAFAAFRARREANPNRYQTSYQFLAGLIDAIIERVADILEGAGADLDQISLRVFDRPVSGLEHASRNPLSRTPRGKARKARQRDFVAILTHIGAASDLVSRARESLVSFVRLMTFFREVRKEEVAARDALVHSKTVVADLGSLSDHAGFLASKVGFLLDATLGMINNEQNAIIKILSVGALVFLPPTLVAGIYGMNFEVMPELRWIYGYPFALSLMVLAAVLPYLFFRRKGWL